MPDSRGSDGNRANRIDRPDMALFLATEHVVPTARSSFRRLRLRIDSAAAGQLCLSLGFVRCAGDSNGTHCPELTSEPLGTHGKSDPAG